MAYMGREKDLTWSSNLCDKRETVRMLLSWMRVRVSWRSARRNGIGTKRSTTCQTVSLCANLISGIDMLVLSMNFAT